MEPGKRPARLLTYAPLKAFSEVTAAPEPTIKVSMADKVVLYKTPLATICPPPLFVMLPPDLAEADNNALTAVVVTTGFAVIESGVVKITVFPYAAPFALLA